jgi:DNA-binding NarL/FixJ family response regulator
VLIWISKGFLEDLARIATRGEKNYELVGLVSDTDEARKYLTSGGVDIVILGKGRLEEWSRMWREGAFDKVPQFCALLVTTIPVSTAILMEASEVGIYDAVDLTMDREAIGQRMLELFTQIDRDAPMQNGILDSRGEEHQILRDITDETDRKILLLISQGKFDKEISQELFLSVQTIRNRVSRILTESGARNRTHLAMLLMGGRVGDTKTQGQSNDPDESGNQNQVA